MIGDLLSNARSKVLDLQTCDADPAADAAALRQLALWALRYTPRAAAWDEASGADGLFLDITGCAHLFGGEECLLADISQRFRRFELPVRVAVADTAGAAWAVARHGPAERSIVDPGGQAEALRDLPLAALRFSDAALSLLRRLGIRRVGEVMSQPRAPFAARFDSEVLLRLDQALGAACRTSYSRRTSARLSRANHVPGAHHERGARAGGGTASAAATRAAAGERRCRRTGSAHAALPGRRRCGQA